MADESAAQTPVEAAPAPAAPVAPAKAAAPAGDSPASPFDAILADWTRDFVNNSPASRHVEVYNYLTGHAIPALLAVLKGA